MNWIKNNIILVTLMVLGVIAVFLAKDYSIHDFGNYYFGAHFLRVGEFNSNIYFPHIFNQNIEQLGYSGLYLNYAPNTPFLSLFFYPFTFFSVYTAKIIFNLLSVLLFVISLNKWFPKFKIKPIYILLILFVVAIPVSNGLLFGQVYLLLFYLLSEGYFALKNGKNLKVALFWSIAICLKVFPVFLLVFLLLNKKFKPLSFTIIGVLFLFFISLIFVDFEVWKFYFTDVLSRASKGEIYSEFVPHYQSVDEFLKHYFVFHPNYNLNPIHDNYPLYKGLLLGFKSLLMMVGILLATQKKDLFFQFCYWIFVAMMFSSYGSSYSMVLVLFIVILLLKSKNIFTVRSLSFFGIIVLICNLPVSFFIEFKFPFVKTVLSLLLLLFLFFREVSYDKFRYILGISLFVVIFISIKQEKPVSEKYFTLENQPGLIYDYEIVDSKLIAKYWSEKGEKKHVFDENIANQSTDYIELIDNQIYFNNKQLTYNSSNKIKPIWVNRSTIVYLSDQGRGLGFFNLRELKIPQE